MHHTFRFLRRPRRMPGTATGTDPTRETFGLWSIAMNPYEDNLILARTHSYSNQAESHVKGG